MSGTPPTNPHDALFDAWQTGQYRTYEELARAKGITKQKLQDALTDVRSRALLQRGAGNIVADPQAIASAIRQLIAALEARAFNIPHQELLDALAPDPGRTIGPISRTLLPDTVKAALEELLAFILPGSQYRYRQPYRALEILRRCLSLLDKAGTAATATRPDRGESNAEGENRPTAKGRTGKRSGGKPRLEKRDPLKFQVYERIKREHKPNEEYADCVERLKQDKDFCEQVTQARLKLTKALVRKALAFFDQREARNKQQTDRA